MKWTLTGAVIIGSLTLIISCSPSIDNTVPLHLREQPAPNFKNNHRVPLLSTKEIIKPVIKKAPNNEKWKVNAAFCESMNELIHNTQSQIETPVEFDVYQNRLRRKVRSFPSLLSENDQNQYLERYMMYVSEMVEEVNGLNIEHVLEEFQEYEEYFTF